MNAVTDTEFVINFKCDDLAGKTIRRYKGEFCFTQFPEEAERFPNIESAAFVARKIMLKQPHKTLTLTDWSVEPVA